MSDFVSNDCRLFERTYIESFDKNQNILNDQTSNGILRFTVVFTHFCRSRKTRRLATELHWGKKISWRLSYMAQSKV